MKAVLSDEPFSDPGWIFERKLDGIRCIAHRDGSGVRLLSRTDRDMSGGYPELVAALEAQPAGDFVIDGEVVALDSRGVTSFQRLQRRGKQRVAIYLYVFDLLRHEGADLRALALRERKAALRKALRFEDPIRYTPHRNRDGERLFEEACRKGLEGIIAKRADSRYTATRSRDWLKLKCHAEQELVIGGYTAPQGSRTDFGALLVGYYEDGRLRYAGKVGTGFDRSTLAELGSQLRALESVRQPLRRRRADPPRDTLGRAGAGGPDRLFRVDSGRPPAPSALSRPARRQARPRGRQGAPRLTVEITSPGKLLFPADGVTKADLASYYERVAEWMLPHIRGRPLSLQRFPAGIAQRGFFHKDVPDYFPDWVERVEVAKHDGSVTHALAGNVDTLVYLVGQNTITPHVWLSRADRIHQPDRLVVDLDPAPGADFAVVRGAARRTGELMRELGLEPFAQVTGSKGIHVWTPVRRRADFEEVKEFANELAALLAARYPDELTTEFRKAERGGRILVDVMRNRYAQTVVPPYAVRPLAGAPVATPIEWDELSNSRLRADRWTVKTVLRRLAAKGDPWADMQAHARGLSAPRRRLHALMDAV